MHRYTDADAKYHRFHVLKAVLAFMAEHANIVQDSFWPVVDKVLEWLLQIAQMKSRDVRKLAWAALANYVGCVADILVVEDSEGENEEKKKEVCTAFVKRFLGLLQENWQLDDVDDTPAERTSTGLADTSLPMVIRALGQFARAIRKYFGHEELRKVLQELIEYAQVMFIDESGDSINPNARPPDIESHLSRIMTSLAQIIKEIPVVDEDIRTHVDVVVGQKLLVLFPRLPDVSKRENCEGLWKLLLALDTVDFHISEALVDVVVREAVSLAVSRQEVTVDDATINYLDDYVEFFQLLLDEGAVKGLCDDDRRRHCRLARRVYDGLIEKVLSNLDRLDLSFVKERETDVSVGSPNDAAQQEDGPAAAQIASGMEDLGPNSLQDYELYLQHVELCTVLLPNLTPEMFNNWAYEYTARIARLCEKDAAACRISGHYKLMRIAFQLCAYGEERQEGYFDGGEVAGVDTRKACRAEFLTFVQRASTRMTQFKDELLVAAVQSVTSVPLTLLTDCIAALVEPMRLGLKLGVSYTPIAEHAIGVLERWLEHSGTLPEASRAIVHGALEAVLPALNGYLYVSAQEGQLSSEEVAAEEAREAMRRESLKEPSTDGLCRRVLRFLGRFGGRAHSLVGAGSIDNLASEIAWDRTERVQVSLPFPVQEHPEIFLDSLLPRIVELAESSSDRRTKVSACELLHAVVLHYVATNSGNTDQGESSSAIYRRLFPVLLRLSVDGETVARNLFEPLMRQLITWFTDPGRDKQGGMDEMLDAVADGVCHQTNSTLREAAAGKFALLLKWSLKQYRGRSRRDELGSPTPLTIEGLFGKIFNMATHPDPYKRIGASLAFRQLANEMTNSGSCTASILEEYLFQFVDRFLTGLRLSEKDPEALEAASLATRSIRYCVRVFKHRSDCDFSRGEAANALQQCVERSLTGTGDGARAYRDVCMYLFPELVTKLHDLNGHEEDKRYTCISYLRAHPVSTLEDTVESTARYLDHQGWANDTLISLYETENVQSIDRWRAKPPEADCLSRLAAISSCACGYTFLIKNQIVRAEALVGGRSNFMANLERWILSFADCSTPSDSGHLCTLHAAAEMVPAKCQKMFAKALLDAFGFVAEAIADGSFPRPELFVQQIECWLCLVLMCLTHPIRMCFVDAKQQLALRNAVVPLLETFGKNASLAQQSINIMKKLYSNFADYKRKGWPDWMAIRLHKFNLANKDDYANLLPVILNHGTLIRALPELRTFFQKFIQKVFSLRGRPENKEGTAITIDPDASTSDVTISKAVLEFCLNTYVSLTQLTEAMSDSHPAEFGEEGGRTRGEVFCNRYGELVRQTVLSDGSSSIHLDAYMDMLCNCSLTHPYFYEVIDEVIKGCQNEQRKKTILEQVVTFFNSAPHVPEQASDDAGIHSSKRMALVDTLVRRSEAGSRAVISSGVLTQVFMDSLDIRRNRLSTVEAALKIVPWLLGADEHEDDVTKRIIRKLQEICSEKVTYVLDPNELLRPGKGKELSEWVQLLKQMLTMLTMCNSMRVVQLFYPLLAMQNDHVHKRDIFKAFECFAANHASPALFHECWSETCDRELSFPLRQALMDYICAPMIQFMTPEYSRQAVARVMHEITDALKLRPPMTCAKLETAALAFSLLEAAYRKLATHVLHPPGQQHTDEEDKAFYRDILKTTTSLFKTEVVRPLDENEEAFRESRKQYHTRAFRLAANCLVKTQTQGKFFDRLLLRFGKAGENIWTAVVGTQDAPEPFTAESTFTTQNIAIGLLREQTREEKALTLAQPGRFSSQFIEGSSLAADVGYTMPSMSQSIQQDTDDAMTMDAPGSPNSQAAIDSQTLPQVRLAKQAVIVETAEDGGVVTSVNPETMVELDPLNQNPCMDATMRLVRFRFKISEETGEYDPPWIQSLEEGVKHLVREMPIDRMDRGDDKCGGKGLVLLYMVKIIMNTPKEFAPYATRFLPHMVSVACRNHANGGNGIHYFVRDICTTLLRWAGMHDPRASPQIGLDSSSETCIEQISALVAHLITHVLSHQLSQSTWKKIFHANLSLIQDFVETFQPTRPSGKYIAVPADIFHGLLSADDARFKAGGIQALSLCLQNNVNIVDGHHSLQHLYELIFPLLGHRTKSVHGPAAELLAYALRLGNASDPRGIPVLIKNGSLLWKVMHQVRQFSQGRKAADTNTFVYVLYKMCSGGKVDKGQFNGAPHIAHHFRVMVLQVLPKLRGDFLTRGIQVLVLMANNWQIANESRVNIQEEALKLLKEIRPWVISFVRQRHPGVQLSTLQLLSVVTRQLSLDGKDNPGAPCREQIAYFMPMLCQVFSTHKKVRCRELFFSIVIWVWENFDMDSKDTVGPDRDTDALCMARASMHRVLIHGLADEAEVVRALMFSFWNHADRLDGDMQRIPQLLTKLYIPEVEEQWAGIACSLLLQICEDSDRWLDRPFSGLVSSTGQKDIDVHKWSSTPNPLTTPLYSSSQSLLPTGMVEATQDMSVDLSQTFARRDASQTMSELAEATVMQVVEREKTISRQHKRDRDGFKMPSPKRGIMEDSMAAGYVRFQKRPAQGGSGFVMRAEKKRKREETLTQNERRTKRVRMLRKYREGERPDFGGLCMKDIFEPLRDLALKDRLFSRLLMDALFAATTSRQFVAKITSGHVERQAYTNKVVTGLCGILQTTNGSPTIVSWLLSAFERLTWKELSTNAQGLTPSEIVARIGQLSLQCCCYHRAIKTLEALELGAQYEESKRRSRSGRSGSNYGTAQVATGTLAAASTADGTLASADTSPAETSRRQEMHLQLGSIYRALGDEDTAITIWSQSVQAQADLSSGTSIMTAGLRLEITQKYADAQAKYTQAKQAGADTRICDDGLYACAARLQEWDEVAKVTGNELRQSLRTPTKRLSRFDCGELLDRFLRGYMKTSMDSRTDIEFLQDPHIAECLEKMHPLSSGALALYAGDRAKAEVSVDTHYNQFVAEWSTYHKLACNVRLAKLRSLQRAVELEETMDCVVSLNRLDAAKARESINSLLTGWRLRPPLRSADTDVWADLLTSRQTNLRAVEKRIEQRIRDRGADHEWNAAVKDIRAAEDSWCREIADIAADRAETHLCDRHRNALTDKSGAKLIAATLFVRQQQRNTAHTYNEKLSKYSKGLSAMTKRFSDHDSDYMASQGKAYLLKAELCAAMMKTINRLRENEQDRSWIGGVEWAQECETTHCDADWHVREACDAFTAAEEKLPQDTTHVSLSHMRCTYANFCREALPHARDKDSLANTMVQQLLQAMAGGSTAARMSFPSVLSVLSEHPSTCVTFAEYSPRVPVWMFLMWCRQIISRVNQVRPETDVLIGVLIRLAEEYPQTVYYPFCLSYSDFNKAAKKKAQPLIDIFEKLPVARSLQRFVRAVGLLTDPWSRALGWLEEIDTAKQQGDESRCKKLVKAMRTDLFVLDKALGKLNRQFAMARFGDSFEALNDVVSRIRAYGELVRDGNGNETIKIHVLTRKELHENKKALEKQVRNWKQLNKPRMEQVDTYSTFLHKDLLLLPADESIELPGLWDGLTRPDSSKRVTIAGFKGKMTPLASIRAPKKVTLFGSDDKEYPFCAKGGEDLRLDERLEQLFVVMNAHLRQDPEARARQLYIRTFGVTPVSKRAGLLEWCQNTEQLGAVVNDECKAMFARYTQLKQASNDHSEILHAEPWTRNWSNFCRLSGPRVNTLKNGQKENLLEAGPVHQVGSNGVINARFRQENWVEGQQGYTRLLAADPDLAGELFRQALSETPKYLLKARLLKLAPSPEAYLQLRANCARTWSTANIAGYIAGVGDRHTGNLLLDNSDGSMVAIDFGYSFGVPFLLGIPELTPFRLSPQLLQCFEPLNGKECITQMMTQTMRVLRQVSFIHAGRHDVATSHCRSICHLGDC